MPSDADLLVAFRGWQEQRNLSRRGTIVKYGQLHRAWSDWLTNHDKSLLRADRDDVTAWLAERRLTPRSRYHYLSRLSALYRWLVDEGHADTDPTARIPRPKLPEPVPRPISTDDLMCALEMASPRTRAFMTLAAFAGFRCIEIAGLRVDDVLDSYDPPVLVVTSPKGLRERVVPMHPEVRAALRAYGMPRAGFVFAYWGDPGRHVQPHTVSHDINNHLHALGIPATAHRLRSWFATSTYRLSLDLVLVQHLLGHRSAATTRAYVAVIPNQAADVVARLSARPGVSSQPRRVIARVHDAGGGVVADSSVDEDGARNGDVGGGDGVCRAAR